MDKRPAFIFDLDGVITDTAHYHYLAWKETARHVGVPFDAQDNEQLKGVGRRESLDFILRRANRTYSEDEISTLLQKKNAHYIELIRALSPKDILSGVKRVLCDLHLRGHPIGLASASKNAAMVLHALGISALFDYVADAALIPNSKPAPDVFLDVAAAFSLPPEQCIGIEDAIAGVQAINAAHMFSVGIGDRTVLAHAQHIYPSMHVFDIDEVLAAWQRTHQ